MNTEHPLTYEIDRLTSVFRLHTAIRGSAWGVIVGLLGLLVAALLARLSPLWTRTDLLLSLIWVLGSAVLGGTIIGYAWPKPLPQRVRLFDKRLQLSDRLTTAWELHTHKIEAPVDISELQKKDTVQILRSVDPAPAFPAYPPRAMEITMLVLALSLLATFLLANPQEAILAELQEQQQAAETAAGQLESIQETLRQDSTLDKADLDAALQALEKAASVLRDRRSTPEEQQAALSAAERQIETLRTPETEEQIQRLAAAAPLSAEEVVRPLAEALERGDAQAAADYLRSLTDPANGELLTEEETLAVADALEEIAANLQESDPQLAEQFSDIAKEIYSGDLQGATEALNEAAETLNELNQANAPNQALEQAQASVQQTQDNLNSAQGNPQSAAEQQANASQQPGTQGQPSNQGQPGDQGQPGGQEQSGDQGQPGGQGQPDGQGQPGSGNSSNPGHHEDSGSSDPYGPDQASRIDGSGGEITLPREQTQGEDPQTTLGNPNNARVPYQDVYATYAEAAEAELSRKAYPPALRSYIRNYFSGLEGNP